MASQRRTASHPTDRGTPPVVALDAILEVVRRCGPGLLNDYFYGDAWTPYAPVDGRRRVSTLAQQRADRVKRLEEDAAAKRETAGQLSRSATYPRSGRSRTKTLSSAQLRQLARQRQDAAARLRKISTKDLAIVQKALDVFILREGGRHALAVLAPVDMFKAWLKRSCFRCGYCDQPFVPIGSFRGGRPHSWCSNAHKTAAARARRRAS